MSEAALAEAPAAPPEMQNEAEAKEPETVVLTLSLFEGYRPTQARLNFGGNIEITSPEVAEALKLGRQVELIVRGEVKSRGHKKTGEGKDAVASSTVVVSSIELFED